MNQSIPDVPLPKKAWVEIYAATAALGAPYALAVGTPITVQNKTKGPILLIESEKAPAPNNRSGLVLQSMEKATVLAGSLGVWMVSRQVDGAVFVQEIPK